MQTASKATAVFFGHEQFRWKAQIQASGLAALEKPAQLQVTHPCGNSRDRANVHLHFRTTQCLTLLHKQGFMVYKNIVWAELCPSLIRTSQMSDTLWSLNDYKQKQLSVVLKPDCNRRQATSPGKAGAQRRMEKHELQECFLKIHGLLI